ncbi:apolipo protein O-domain-containing protein [Coniochaeta sp. 2T2.1]|nr:apolipo protein O-domain-containing protein [Coniochaeta sp. 2T2.1]
MAARLLVRQRAMAPLTATLLAGGIALYPTVAHAEAPHSSKKPIYDDYDAPPTTATLHELSKPSPPQSTSTTSAITAMITGNSTTSSSSQELSHPRSPTPTDRLASQIRLARLWLYARASSAESSVDRLLTRVFETEASVTSTLSSLAPAPESGERLMPGAVYVLVSSMAGSIFVRNRNVLLRAAGPVGFGVAAAWALLPVTMGNVSGLLWEYERKFPAVADAHLKTREGIEKAGSFARVHAQLGVRKVEETVHDAREAVEGWVRKGK